MSTHLPRVGAMQPSRPGPTRTADPRPPDHFPGRGRYRAYIAFGSCGLFLMLSSLLVLRVVWDLSEGEAAWNALMESFANPIYRLYHVLALIGLVWFSVRFFRLFPKTQPPRLGPAPRPPDAVFLVGLNGAFVLVNLLAILILRGTIL